MRQRLKGKQARWVRRACEPKSYVGIPATGINEGKVKKRSGVPGERRLLVPDLSISPANRDYNPSFHPKIQGDLSPGSATVEK